MRIEFAHLNTPLSTVKMADITGTKTYPTFTVTRCATELIRPAQPTPHERKELSDIDCAVDYRFLGSLIQTYKSDGGQHLQGVHPAKVIKEAVAKALVWYYPLAGRVRAVTRRKLVVECTEEGILFIEANADVTLEEFGEPIYPPSYMKELLYDVPEISSIIDCPLLLIQVTRLKCGGFIFAIRFNHTTIDGVGITMFLNAVAELANGAESPSIKPVWERHLLSAPPNLLQVSYDNNVYNKGDDDIEIKEDPIIPYDDLVYKTFFFGPTEIAALRHSIPPSEGRTTDFELIAAHVWRSHTIALVNDPNEVVQLICPISVRSKLNPPLPKGYYGGAILCSGARTTAIKLSENPLHDALKLVKEVKLRVDEEYIKSCIGGLSGKDTTGIGLVVSDHTRLGLDTLDFGWGKPIYGGTPHVGINQAGIFFTFLVPYKHFQENGVLVPICLPRLVMNKFVKIVALHEAVCN